MLKGKKIPKGKKMIIVEIKNFYWKLILFIISYEKQSLEIKLNLKQTIINI